MTKLDSLIHMEKDFTPQKNTAGLFEEQLLFHTIGTPKFEPKMFLFTSLFVSFNYQSTGQTIGFILKHIFGVCL